MLFRIADSFTKSLRKLTAQEQSAAKVTVFDLQQDPTNPGLQFHRIENSKDPNFWSIRVNRDVRIIVHKTASSFLAAYVAHHDDAYKWAERRRIETHPKTGAAQIVEVRERVEEITSGAYHEPARTTIAGTEGKPPVQQSLSPFLKLDTEDILNVGVPQDWIDDVLQCSEDSFFDIAEHIPAEAAEALLEYAATGVLKMPPALAPISDPFNHPDAMRRFRIMDDADELTRALSYPWDQWTVFLHPSQRETVDRRFSGPARVSGSAGTGKTVVALHRVASVLQHSSKARILLTTFSAPLANALEKKLPMLVGSNGSVLDRATVLPFIGVAKELFVLAFGYDPREAKPEHALDAIRAAVKKHSNTEFTERFLVSEWTHVVDAWQIDSLEAYKSVPRLGRKSRMGMAQRKRAWPIFESTRSILEDRNILTAATIFGHVTQHYKERHQKPFTHIVVDEAQDLGVPELRMLAAIADKSEDALFFAGDQGQRIFQEPFSWLALGVDIRGRASTLKVNYRTSHQIRQALDRLLPDRTRDSDGVEEDRTGTVSVFNGPVPLVLQHQNADEETRSISTRISELIGDGIVPDEIGIFVRTHEALLRARQVVRKLSIGVREISERAEDTNGRVSIGTMHLAKGLEFKAVIVMACDDDLLPLQTRMETAADEADLDQVYETERHLFYVACTRARDRLIISGVAPGSEFIEDLRLAN